MEKYTIYCTEEQTKKAFELGAPIKTISYDPPVPSPTGWVICKENCCKPPTAEQMIGWMEEKGIKEFSIYGANDNKWRYEVWIEYGRGPIRSRSEGYISRKEATLAAIDAALDYII